MPATYTISTENCDPQLQIYLIELAPYGVDLAMIANTALEYVCRYGHPYGQELTSYITDVLCQQFEVDGVDTANSDTMRAIQDQADKVVTIGLQASELLGEYLLGFLFNIDEMEQEGGVNIEHLQYVIEGCMSNTIILRTIVEDSHGANSGAYRRPRHTVAVRPHPAVG